MKNLLSLLALSVAASVLAALAPTAAQAKIWRVDNNGGSPGNFTTLQAAFNAGSGVANNDTLYVNGSGTSYGDATVDKRVYIFGPGYFLAQNPETQASPTSATAGIITFSTAASGSLLTGMSFGRLAINADNVLIKRNYGYTGSGATIEVQAGRSNVLLVQNYLYNNAYDRVVLVQGGCSNVLIANNWLGSNYTGVSGNYAHIYASSSVTITQNVFNNNYVYADNSTITNNIFYSNGGISGSGNGILNNLTSNANLPSGNGNVSNVTMTDVFVLSGSDDGYWKLKANSPALAAGANGEDCGMYGGTDPYVLSGMPAIPAIWFFAAPTSGSGASGLQVHLKAKSHN